MPRNYWGDCSWPFFRIWVAEAAIRFAMKFIPARAGAMQPLQDAILHLEGARRVLRRVDI